MILKLILGIGGLIGIYFLVRLLPRSVIQWMVFMIFFFIVGWIVKRITWDKEIGGN